MGDLQVQCSRCRGAVQVQVQQVQGSCAGTGATGAGAACAAWPCILEAVYDHRVDSVIESSLREIIGRKNFALINLSLNFCETTIHDNKVFLENLVAVH